MLRRNRSDIIKDKEKVGEIRVFRLRNIFDGGLYEFVDEGPFETDPDFQKKDPSNGRQRLIAALDKFDSSDGLPVFFGEPGVKYPPVFMNGRLRDIPIATKAIIEKLEKNLIAREEMQGAGRSFLEAAKKRLEENLDASSRAVVASVAKITTPMEAALGGLGMAQPAASPTADSASLQAALGRKRKTPEPVGGTGGKDGGM